MPAIIGWDLGGAHLKGARLERDGRLAAVVQLPCTLWLGLEHLDRALEEALRRLGPAEAHAVTMTGELVDYFPDRAEGVRRLTDRVAERLREVRIWGGPLGFLSPARARAEPRAVASANWLASVAWAARRLGFSRKDEIAIVFCGSKKSMASGIPMAKILFAGQLGGLGALVLPLMIFHQLQLMVCAVVARRYATRGDHPDAEDQRDAA